MWILQATLIFSNLIPFFVICFELRGGQERCDLSSDLNLFKNIFVNLRETSFLKEMYISKF